jgi:chorismate mutase
VTGATARGPLAQSALMRTFALRGATSVERDEPAEIVEATAELMREIEARNQLSPEMLISCVFTVTPDLRSEFPAVAARRIGFEKVPLLCAQEIPVPGSMPRVIRVLIHYNAEDSHEPEHVYLGETKALRADLHAAQ